MRETVSATLTKKQTMTDITKCNNDSCTIKDTCARYTTPPNPLWQSYAYYVPSRNGKCAYYLAEYNPRKISRKVLVDVSGYQKKKISNSGK